MKNIMESSSEGNVPSAQPKLRVALILDQQTIRKWQLDALKYCSDILSIELILNCRNTHTKKSLLKHFIYYVINFFSLRNPLTCQIRYSSSDESVIHFDSNYTNAWQSFPSDVIDEINRRKLDFVIKFGMNLLTVPTELNTKFGILSYHHGDPEKYRGRPAGFHELFQNEERIGIIVQKLSNKLDGGDICASAYSKIFHHSYRKTAMNFYRNSAPLLRKAILNLTENKLVKNNAQGKNYTLPTNLQAVYFIALLLIRKIRRLAYGAFMEKRWNIFFIPMGGQSLPEFLRNKLKVADGTAPKIPKQYVFFADPFFSQNGEEVYAEALNRKTGLGEIVSFRTADWTLQHPVLMGSHHSYPQTVSVDQSNYLFPEISSLTSQHFVRLNEDGTVNYETVKGLESYRLVDATYFVYENTHYIFASEVVNASDNLLLFIGNDRLGPYKEHPLNPIVMDPACARMGGSIISDKGKLYRAGQDNSRGYGRRIWICEITDLSPTKYSERKTEKVGFPKPYAGPHTINVHETRMVVDFYTETVSVTAGIRRLLNYMKRR